MLILIVFLFTNSTLLSGERMPFITGVEELSVKNGVYQLSLPYNRNNIDFEFSTFDFVYNASRLIY